MPRPVTLFTGQWADLPLEKLAPLVKQMGYDGVELACWGDHFEVDMALSSKTYAKEKWDLLRANGLSCSAVSNHLVGQAVCDLIDDRHKSILPPDVWGDGKAEGVRKRAAAKMISTAKAARKFFDARPGKASQADCPAVVNGFTGSSIWHSI
jgi:sugar phosphate isomerase/epimerase